VRIVSQGIVADAAILTAQVDVTADSLVQPLCLEGRRGVFVKGVDDSDEFVAEDAGETHVALQNLQICIANSGAKNTDESVIHRRDGRNRYFDDVASRSVGFDNVGFHGFGRRH